jgi:hypothetical protein
MKQSERLRKAAILAEQIDNELKSMWEAPAELQKKAAELKSLLGTAARAASREEKDMEVDVDG